MRSARGRTADFAIVVAALALGACGTVDPGPPTGPPMGCNGSPKFFVTDVWPKYLSKLPPGPPTGCGQQNCHDYLTGKSSFRLQPVDGVAAPDPTMPPAMWADAWRFNYVNATRELNCADPTSSRLLAKPEQSGTSHQGGTLVDASSTPSASDAAMLFAEWAMAQ